MIPLIAVGYARFSTKHQNPKSVEDQGREIQELCDRENLKLREMFEDRAITGQIQRRRSGYQALLAAVASGEIQVVVAENIERLTRDEEHSARLKKLCRFHGVKIITCQDGWANGLSMSVKALTSQMTIDSVRKQAHRGNRAKVLAGKSAGGLCYGYRVKLDDGGRAIRGERVIDDDQAAIIRRIYTMYSAGSAPAAIAAKLNAEGVPAPRGQHWKQNTLNGNAARGTGILNNELYRGVIVWNRLEWRRDPETEERRPIARDPSQIEQVGAPHLRIVDEMLWQAVKTRQAELGKRRPSKGISPTGMDTAHATRRPKYLLSGLLSCSICGGDLTVAGSGHKRYYCANAKQKGPSVCRGMSGLGMEEAQSLILDGLKRALMTDEALDAFRTAFTRHLSEQSRDAGSDKRAAEAELRRVETKIRNLVAAISAGAGVDSIIGELRSAEARKQELAQTIAQMNAPAPTIPVDAGAQYRKVIQELGTVLSDTALVVRASDQLGRLIDRIVVKEIDKCEHEMEIVANPPAMFDVVDPAVGARLSAESSLRLVAGVGFEPTTFRL